MSRIHRQFDQALTEAYLYSYCPKTIEVWNSLPGNISKNIDIDRFRAKINNGKFATDLQYTVISYLQ